MSRRKKRSAFDKVSEFNRGRIVAYQDCGLLFREIGSRVGRNQTTVMRICDRWTQDGTTNRRGRSHPPQCTTSLSARTIRRHLQQSGLSARRPLLGLPLMQNHRRLRRQSCDERRMWAAEWNEVVFTDESRICLQHHDAVLESQTRYLPSNDQEIDHYDSGGLLLWVDIWLDGCIHPYVLARETVTVVRYRDED
ncbi:transposable element Tcb1 transposase [Trichonephila clavipes]|nr:transposable element Tcb1 transposase [Trichonephila clavipes]